MRGNENLLERGDNFFRKDETEPGVPRYSTDLIQVHRPPTLGNNPVDSFV
jgi:hypothetical protein